MSVFLVNFLVEASAGVATLFDPTFLFGHEGAVGGGRIASAFFGACAIAQGVGCLLALRGSAATKRAVGLSALLYHASLVAMWFVFPEFNLIGSSAVASLSKNIPALRPFFASLSTETRDLLAMGALLGIHSLLAVWFLATIAAVRDRPHSKRD